MRGACGQQVAGFAVRHAEVQAAGTHGADLLSKGGEYAI